MNMDKKFFVSLRADLDNALAAVAAKHGVSMNAANITYDPQKGTATIKVNLVTKPSTNANMDMKMLQDERTYERWYWRMGLPKLKTPFVDRGQQFLIVGMRVGGPYKSIICQSVHDKKLYRFKPDHVKMCMKEAVK